MPNDATPIPHPPSATQPKTRAALAWVIAVGLLRGNELAAASEPLAWNPHAQWLASPGWGKGVFMIHLVWRATPRLRFSLFRDHPHPLETRTTFHLPDHVFVASA